MVYDCKKIFHAKFPEHTLRNSVGVHIQSEYFIEPGSNDTQVLENDITGNDIGIYTQHSSAVIHFNRIAGNDNKGIFIAGGYS
ncbi:MAG: right-handed parallel beta-helix repeat-containing protein [Methanobacteriaceae archaeon]|nr:right-handed parallel beta-helix repeat-containing protein [Methanobacteriaceae archaeon]